MRKERVMDEKQEPVAWGVMASSSLPFFMEWLYANKKQADEIAEEYGGTVIPLYRIPAFGDDAKAAILEAAGCYVAECDELQAAGVVVEPKRLAVRDTLRGLLERLG